MHEFGLIPAIKWKLDQTSKKYNIATSFYDNDISTNFETDTNLIIYRIICELIANVIKHADANEINVEIVKTRKDYFFTVTDNGKGLEPNSIEEPQGVGTFGLFSISERLDSMNGSLILESEPGKGTTAKVFIPG